MGEIGYVVTHAGNRYIVAVEMAEIFARKRERLLKADRGELVPLPHTGGVDILWVDAMVPCEITPIPVPDGCDVDAVRAQWGLRRRSSGRNARATAASRRPRPDTVSG